MNSRITTYPRKGTETETLPEDGTDPYITTYPRKGTETIQEITPSACVLNYNLSPQGDGNESRFNNNCRN